MKIVLLNVILVFLLMFSISILLHFQNTANRIIYLLLHFSLFCIVTFKHLKLLTCSICFSCILFVSMLVSFISAYNFPLAIPFFHISVLLYILFTCCIYDSVNHVYTFCQFCHFCGLCFILSRISESTPVLISLQIGSRQLTSF